MMKQKKHHALVQQYRENVKIICKVCIHLQMFYRNVWRNQFCKTSLKLRTKSLAVPLLD